MTRTESYSAMRRALLDVAEEFGCTPYVARVLLAVHERGGSAVTRDLYVDLFDDGPLVRRALMSSYDVWLRGTAEGGGPRRLGVWVQVALTLEGAKVVTRLLERFEEYLPAGAVAA